MTLIKQVLSQLVRQVNFQLWNFHPVHQLLPHNLYFNVNKRTVTVAVAQTVGKSLGEWYIRQERNSIVGPSLGSAPGPVTGSLPRAEPRLGRTVELPKTGKH